MIFPQCSQVLAFTLYQCKKFPNEHEIGKFLAIKRQLKTIIWLHQRSNLNWKSPSQMSKNYKQNSIILEEIDALVFWNEI